MAAPRRSKFQIEDNRRDSTRLYLRGKTQSEIAELLGISRSMVAYDLNAIQEQWRENTVRDLDADKVRELAKTDELERIYWAAWESSLEQRETTATARTEAGDSPSHHRADEEGDAGREPGFPGRSAEVHPAPGQAAGAGRTDEAGAQRQHRGQAGPVGADRRGPARSPGIGRWWRRAR